MKLRADQTGDRGLPMPLWLQGALETAQAAIISALVVIAPIIAVWATAGFQNAEFDVLARLAGQAWLLIHGVPLVLADVGSGAAGSAGSGMLTLVPLGLTLIPFLLAWRAGRRLARASYTDQLWQALLGSWMVYAAFGAATGFVCRTADVVINLWYAMLVPLIPYALGMVVGARREAGSWSRLIGVDAVAWISRTSQHSRWAGSYLASAAKAGFVALASALALACVLLATDLFIHWNLVVAVYEALDAGALGGAALTIAQLGYLPNLAVFALAWTSGAGFAMGVGSQVGPLGTATGPLPSIPVFAAIPAGSLDYGFVALVVPVLAGSLAGWWFLREGENHFDEWLSIKIHARWFTATVSTLALGVLVGVVAGLLSAALAWLARGSAGLGRLTDIGPDPLWTAAWVAAEVGIGVVIGYAAGPWLERQQQVEEEAELAL
ncbi:MULTISPECIES: cell division protein PerM [unclassified Pseudarthrobacter]|uniref:cell division protein PerM n=1 Tax=unclassified Pseudarthrobacter TaxID=2647000 RepID=UPI0030780279